MNTRNRRPTEDDPATAFPASENTPGQAESRTAYARLPELAEEEAWWDDYLSLRQEKDKDGNTLWDWRKAVYIAWASLPESKRRPKTQKELATQILGLSDDRTIRKWRANNPDLDNRIAKLTSDQLFQHRASVLHALIAVASSIDPKAHPDRKLFLELTGDYKPRSALTLTGDGDGPVSLDLMHNLDEANLDKLIANLQAAVSSSPAGETPPPGDPTE